jgi:Arc/MetJ-type ribon-helix-helix transcriptional regulator
MPFYPPVPALPSGTDAGTDGFIPTNHTRPPMPESEVTLPDQVTSDIDRFVESGEFLNWDQAVEELLTLGLSAYQSEEEDVTTDESVFTGAVEDQQDPAIADDDPGSDRMY